MFLLCFYYVSMAFLWCFLSCFYSCLSYVSFMFTLCFYGIAIVFPCSLLQCSYLFLSVLCDVSNLFLWCFSSAFLKFPIVLFYIVYILLCSFGVSFLILFCFYGGSMMFVCLFFRPNLLGFYYYLCCFNYGVVFAFRMFLSVSLLLLWYSDDDVLLFRLFIMLLVCVSYVSFMFLLSVVMY